MKKDVSYKQITNNDFNLNKPKYCSIKKSNKIITNIF